VSSRGENRTMGVPEQTKLINSVLKTFPFINENDRDDFKQIGYETILIHSRRFDESKKLSYKNWLFTKVRWAILTEIRKPKRNKVLALIDYDTGKTEKAVHDDKIELDYLIKDMMERLNQLTKIRRKTFVLRYILGYSGREIAAMEGVSEFAISLRLKAARKHLRN
jgi:RNA polymerase sigma factor (sigma-70 family)